MKIKKLFKLLTFLSAVSFCFASCGSGDKGNVLTVWCPRADQVLAKEIATQFQTENPTENVVFKFAVQGEDEAATKILNDVEAAADVFSFSSDQLNKLVNGDALTRLGGDRLERIINANTANSIDSATVTVSGDDAVYAFPYTDNTFFLYYNKSYLTETDVETLDGILAKCSQTKKFAMPLTDGWYNTSFYFGKDLGYTVEYSDNLTETKITCDFNNPTGTKVTEALWSYVQDRKVMADANDSKISAGFSDGTVIAAVSGIWNKTVFKNYLGENFGVAKLPTYTFDRDGAAEEQVQLVSFAGYKLIGVNQYSKKKTTALKFAEYYTNKANQIKRFEIRGFLPTNIEAQASEGVQNDLCAQAIKAQLEFSKTQKNVPSTLWIPMQGLGNAMVTAATTGGTFNLATELNAYVRAIELNARD